MSKGSQEADGVMANVRELNVSLLDWETRIVLESVSRELSRLKEINETSEDEDIAADAGNDYLEMLGFKERLEATAVSIFGEQIKDFSCNEVG